MNACRRATVRRPRTRLARTRSLAAPALEDDMTQHFDAIVIGTGQAGPPLAARCPAPG